MRITIDGLYGVVLMPPNIFNTLDSKFFITGCTDDIKYMCANEGEFQYLESLGVEIIDRCFDWFKICRDDNWNSCNENHY